MEIQAGNYQVVMQNNFPTQGAFSKQLLITEVGGLGVANHLIGFTLFSYGILLLFLHVYLCYRWKKWAWYLNSMIMNYDSIKETIAHQDQ